MERQTTVQNADDIVQSYLRARDRSESESLLTILLQEHAEPIITGIIKNKLRVSLNIAEGSVQNQDALEIAGDVRAILLAEMQGLKNGAQRRAIINFQNYVAIKAYSVCADYFRAKNPERRRLKDLLRYHLKQNPRFALWEDTHTRWLCGFQVWSGAPGAAEVRQLFPATLADGVSVSQLSPADLLTAIFESAGQPMEFNRLVTIVADLWEINDLPPESLESDERASEALVDSTARVDAVLEQRLYLQRLWEEVAELPPLQRSALLLNLRDTQGSSAIAFVPHLGIAAKTEIAEMLSMTPEQFSAVWDDLPLDDASIARMLGVTRQQVINLRKTARERLARRMSAMEKRPDSNK